MLIILLQIETIIIMKFIRFTRYKKIKNSWQGFALFHCDYCGRKVEKVYGNGLKHQSCGCAHKRLLSECSTIHGDYDKPLNKIWRSMKSYCNNPKDPRYQYYGLEGIKVTRKWDKYKDFKRWALDNGYKNNLVLDRKDYSKNFTPSNCIFVTRREKWLKIGMCLLSDSQAKEIIEKWNTSLYTYGMIKKNYKVCTGTIGYTVKNYRKINGQSQG